MNLRFLSLLLLALTALAAPNPADAPARLSRAALVACLSAEDPAERHQQLQALAAIPDPRVAQALSAWRGGALFLWETNGQRIPFLLDAQTDNDGRAKALQWPEGQPILDAAGQPLWLSATDLTAVDSDSRLRKQLKTALDVLALAHPDQRLRRDAVIKLGQEQNVEFLPHFRGRLAAEPDAHVRRALQEAIAVTELTSEGEATRLAAIRQLQGLRSIGSLNFLEAAETVALRDRAKAGEPTIRALHQAILSIKDYIAWGNLFGTIFRGLSLGAVLLLAALGLAITFGLMGIINMAHGELMAVGAYTAFVMQNIFRARWGAAGTGFDCYFIAALPAAFITAALVGLALERGIIRFLYRRPLESLLATWGVSLVLQQAFRTLFGSANVQVNSPSFLSGSFVVYDVLLAYNRLFVIGFALLALGGTYLLLIRTSLGLQIRAVMQNRAMAACLGVRTDRVNQLTFGLGSGLAGLAGACLSQIANVGPSLGQNYILDCFMVVVLGGVGNLAGTVTAAGGIGMGDQILQPWLGAVLGKITVLAAIILFLQWRPAGLFTTRSRSLDG